MKKFKYLKCLSLIAGFILTVVLSFPVYAKEQSGGEDAVIFLLDVSGSMKTNDPDRIAIDSIAQLIYALPTNYKVGFVAYSSETAVELDLIDNSRRAEIMKAAESLEYDGYSNAGLGLQCAVNLLTEDTAQKKNIVLLSDGEILMDDDVITDRSQQQYRSAVEQAKEEEITIHVIGLGTDLKSKGIYGRQI